MVLRRFSIPFFSAVLCSTLVIFSSCASNKNIPDEEEKITNEKKTEDLTLLFAGDVMAHAPNYKPGKYDRIWRDIKPLVSSADLAFANIEAPVCNSLQWSTYPQFNMHSDYIEAAIDAGFNVFSLANNHTNDQYLEGIKATKKYFDTRKGVWACGVKDKSKGPLTYKVIEKKGWKILFVAITEILNRSDFASYIDYYPSTESKRAKFIEELKVLQKKNKCDLFVVSIHTDEAEYVLSITESHRNFYHKIIEECKADIIWANHPHVVKPYTETQASSFYSKEAGQINRKALIMFANGNTISAQRTRPTYENPANNRDYTGEGLILTLKARKNDNGEVILSDYTPHIITTYITPSWQYVIKLLDEEFLKALDRAEVSGWANYLKERKKLMEKVLKK